MAIKYFVKAAMSEYEDKTDGKMKKRYQSIGVVIETKHGLMLSLESLPFFCMKEGKILAYLNEPEEKADQPRSAPAAKSVDNIDEDIPF
jgi:hypothetical protein